MVSRKKANTATATRNKSGAERANSGATRRRRLLEVAAKLFGSFGYHGASMRDIAQEAGILSGSIYYHFSSKEELLLAVHEKGVDNIMEHVRSALEQAGPDPWDRLQAACIGHLEALLESDAFTQVIRPEFPRNLPPELRDVLNEQRDDYEKIFRGLVEDLPLPKGVERGLFRLGLMGSMNWTVNWYHKGTGADPKDIALQFLRHYRDAMDTGAKPGKK